MKVLVIEDNKSLAKRIKSAISQRSIVDIVHSGEEGICQIQAVKYDVILLDLGLPDIHGLQVCKVIRAYNIKTPVLILTAVDDLRSRVELLDSGADDYVTKPFSGSELNARINALARRQTRDYVTQTVYLGDLEVDLTGRQVRREGVLLPLRRKEFDILEYLIANRGRAVTRQMIIEHVWENDKERWNNTVDVHIKRLRDKIDRPFQTSVIKTAYGIGYMVEDALAINNHERLVQ